jgi:small-conductance mechanosensitive channel
MGPWTLPYVVDSTVLQVTNASGVSGRLREVLPEPVDGFPGIEFVLALATLVVGWYLSKIVVSLLARPVAKRFTRPSVTRIVLNMIRAAVLAAAVFAAANQIGFQQGDLLLSATVFSAVIALVLAPIVGSIINGLFVLADRPYEIGDMIELVDRDTRGYVEDMTLRYTKMFTLDNTFMVIPNSSIRERDVINYSAEDERTRLSLTVVVTYEGDLEEARAIMERSAASVDDVITGGPDIRIGSARYPAAPTCYIDEYGDHGVHLELRFWAKKPYKLQTVRSAVQTEIWDALEDSDVSIAYPHSHLVFDETSGRANVAVDRDSSEASRSE